MDADLKVVLDYVKKQKIDNFKILSKYTLFAL